MNQRPVLLYLHLPKTAGTSLTNILFDQYQDSSGSSEEGGMFCSGLYYYPGEPGFIRPCPANQPYHVMQPEHIQRALRRGDLRAVVGHFSFGLHRSIEQPTAYATLFRHPVERIISLYAHLKRWPRYRENEPWMERVGLKPVSAETSLDEFIRDYPLRELDNDQARRVAGLDPEYGACDRSLLERAKLNIERHFAFIGVAERFDETVRAAAAVLGWSEPTRRVRKLVNEEREPVSSVPARTREAILARNALDLELYSFANLWLDEQLQVTAGEA